ncbi:hypothetical protein OPKNFCMD_5868 [Methylobacterium crusticola]|uniref:Histidine kinase n=1 Tax=Methylobacterium crusticola TaxID=1697972 RepID=A0ABQ4R5X0_9HYPH|nr:hypothetical protein [Methylobacterium crusticola]GJD53097.1 hypothetical protein OPKNFCMD_5868 [Methylobacterium crusticola]
MPILRAVILSIVGAGLITFAMMGVAERGSQSRLDRALRPTSLLHTAGSAPEARRVQSLADE